MATKLTECTYIYTRLCRAGCSLSQAGYRNEGQNIKSVFTLGETTYRLITVFGCQCVMLRDSGILYLRDRLLAELIPSSKARFLSMLSYKALKKRLFSGHGR